MLCNWYWIYRVANCRIIASSGFKVLGVDIDKEKINKLKRGEIYIKEPNLEEIVKEQVLMVI